MSLNAYPELREVYESRGVVAGRDACQGKKRIAVMGSDVPVELLEAAGCVPVRVCGSTDMEMTDTDEFLEYSFDPVVRSQFGKIIRGDYGDCEALVISNSTDALVRIYYYLKEMKRMEPWRRIPEILFIDWLFTPYHMHQERNYRTIERFRRELEDVTGVKLTDSAITEAIRRQNRIRRCAEELAALRVSNLVTGEEALTVIGASFYMPGEEYEVLFRSVMEDFKTRNPREGIRLFYTGSVQEDTIFYQMVESHKAVITGEDHDWGGRNFERLDKEDVDPMRAVADRHMLRMPSPKKAFVDQRVKALREAVRKSQADGVVFFQRTYDDAASWDWPDQEQMLRADGIPCLTLNQMEYDIHRQEDLPERLEKFIREVRRGKEEG